LSDPPTGPFSFLFFCYLFFSHPHLFLFALPSSTTTTATRKQKPGRGRRGSTFLGRIIFSLCVIIALGEWEWKLPSFQRQAGRWAFPSSFFPFFVCRRLSTPFPWTALHFRIHLHFLAGAAGAGSGAHKPHRTFNIDPAVRLYPTYSRTPALDLALPPFSRLSH